MFWKPQFHTFKNLPCMTTHTSNKISYHQFSDLFDITILPHTSYKYVTTVKMTFHIIFLIIFINSSHSQRPFAPMYSQMSH